MLKNTEVIYFNLLNDKINSIETKSENEFGEMKKETIICDKVISADYYYTSHYYQKLRTYSESYWKI